MSGGRWNPELEQDRALERAREAWWRSSVPVRETRAGGPVVCEVCGWEIRGADEWAECEECGQ